MGIISNRCRVLFVLVAFTVLAGCVANYQYSARGILSYENGDKHDAVIYWHKDEGRLWYLKKYEQFDTSLKMRVCRIPSISSFELGNDRIVELKSKRHDIRVARLDVSGAIERQENEPLVEDSRCGVIQVGGKSVGTDGLPENARPEIVILCRNERNSTRYPAVDKHLFDAISRQKSNPEREAPKPCLDSQ